MKTTAIFLPAALLAYTAAAELQLYAYPTPEYEKRDLDAVNTALTQISSAISQLDDSVKAFTSSSSADQVKSDAESLVSTIKGGAEAVASSGAISLEDALGLQDVATQLSTSGQALLKDVQSKKAAFEASELCEDVQGSIGSISSEVQSFVDSIIKQLPEESQATAQQLTNGIASSLSSGSSLFECSGSKGDDSSSSSAAAVVTSTAAAVADDYPVASSSSTAAATASETCLAITVTVTAPCACESSSSSSSSTAAVTSTSVPVVTPSTTVLYPTSSNSTSIVPTGGATTTSGSTIPTAGAASNGVGAAGLMAGLMAALLV